MAPKHLASATLLVLVAVYMPGCVDKEEAQLIKAQEILEKHNDTLLLAKIEVGAAGVPFALADNALKRGDRRQADDLLSNANSEWKAAESRLAEAVEAYIAECQAEGVPESVARQALEQWTPVYP